MYRVLHIFSGYGGGISSLILNLIENKTDDFVFDTLAFSYKGGEEFKNRLKIKGTTLYQMPRPKKSGIRTFFHYLNELFINTKYDAVHCHIPGWMAIPFSVVAKKHGVKTFILHAHTTRYESKIDRIGLIHYLDCSINYKISTDYLTCGNMAAEYVYGKRFLKKRKAHLIANGIKEEIFLQQLSEIERSNYYKEIGLEKTSKVVLHVGRFNEQKNHDFIIKMINDLVRSKNIMNYIFLFVGDGVLLDSIKNEAKSKEIEKYIRFLGRRSDISKLMQFADFMILPSFFEGLPTVAVECQACGTPMLLSDSITKECDMGLELLKFIPINNVDVWSTEIENMSIVKKDLNMCIYELNRHGFTARTAGINYCDMLKKIMNNNTI